MCDAWLQLIRLFSFSIHLFIYLFAFFVSGGFGIDFANNCEAVESGIALVASGILAHGVTSFCPTVVTSSPDLYRKVLPKIQKSDGGLHGANILGLHLEGPFIHIEKKGAHEPEHIRELTQVFVFIIRMTS